MPRTRVLMDRRQLEASLCRDSLFDFVQRFWHTIIPESPIWNWHIEYLCREMQEMAERVFRREPKRHELIINVPPGSTKSTICSVMFPAWCWTRDRAIRTICSSYTAPLSLYLSTLSRQIVQSEKYQALFRNRRGEPVTLTEEQKSLLTNSEGGQRIATSTGGSITGFHGHFLIIDDPIDPKQALSPVQLDAANKWIEQVLLRRKIDAQITPLVLIMQRLAQNDPTGQLLDKAERAEEDEHKLIGRVKHICLPAEITENVRPPRLRHFYGEEGLLDPIRLPRSALDEAQLDGQYVYSGQYLQHPVPPGGGMFRVSQLKLEANLRGGGGMRWVRYWDKAGTEGGGTFTVGLKMGLDASGEFWVADIVRGQWEAAERERRIKQTAELDGTEVTIGIEQEPGSGGKESAQNTVRNLAGYTVYAAPPQGDKAVRADPFATQVNAGNVHVLIRPWTKEYIGELEYFPHSRYTDQADGSSGAFKRLAQSMGLRMGGMRGL